MSRRPLHAGPISLTLDGSEIRWLRLGGLELIRGLYVAVRDSTWGTVAGTLEDLVVDEGGDRFAVAFRSVHREGEVDFVWAGRIVGEPDGTVRYTMDGRARRTFERNRIGFCLLHPMEVAGLPATVDTPSGSHTGVFPVHVSPHQPFPEMTAIRWSAQGLDLEVRYEGDLFEMEDQRNWTDASFKTYCTPLRLPRPVRLQAGTAVRQAVTLRVVSRPQAGRRKVAARVSRSERELTVGGTLGPIPSLGLALAPGRERLAAPDVARLRELRLDHLFVTLDLSREGWRAAARDAGETAHAVHAGLVIEALAQDTGEGLDALVAEIVAANLRAIGIAPFPTTGFVTTTAVTDRLATSAHDAGLAITVAGGSRAHFTELNRAAIPLGLIDAVTYPVTPQVHAFDDASIVETLEAQQVTALDAGRIADGRDVWVGPVTLRPRFNADGAANPSWSLDNEPSRVDPRTTTWFGAIWLLGSMARLAGGGAARITLAEATGPAGLLGDSREMGEATAPDRLLQALASIRSLRGAESCSVAGPSDVAAMAVRHDAGIVLLLGHFGDEPREISLGGVPPTEATVTAIGPDARAIDATRRTGSPGAMTLLLPPATIVRVDVGRAFQ